MYPVAACRGQFVAGRGNSVPSPVRNFASPDDGGMASGTCVLTAPANIPVGNLLVIGVVTNNTAGATTCTDARGNTYTLDASLDRIDSVSGNLRVLTFYCVVSTQIQSSDAITVTLAGTPGFYGAVCQEWTSMRSSSVLDKTAGADGNDASPASGATAATLAENEVAIGVIGYRGDFALVFTPGSGWTQYGSYAGTVRQLAMMYKLLTGSATPSADGTFAVGGYWDALEGTFRGA